MSSDYYIADTLYFFLNKQGRKVSSTSKFTQNCRKKLKKRVEFCPKKIKSEFMMNYEFVFVAKPHQYKTSTSIYTIFTFFMSNVNPST